MPVQTAIARLEWKGTSPQRASACFLPQKRQIVWTLKSRRIIEPTAGVVTG